MPTFPSDEWMDELCRQVAEHPQAHETAEALDGVYRFVVEPSGPLTTAHRYDLEIRPGGDGTPLVRRLPDPDAAPRLTMTANFVQWRQLITGQLPLGLAVMLRRLRISGDLSRVVQNAGGTRPLVEALSRVDSQWPDG